MMKAMMGEVNGGGLIVEDTSATFGQVRLGYLIVTEAGAEVTVGNKSYADNIVLDGVHDDTFIQYVQSHDSARDGIRLQSSEDTANQARLSWLLITGASRDALSYNNFSGLVKDMLVIHRPEFYDGVSGGRAGIYASNGNSLPLFVNVTLAGSDTTSKNSISANNREFGILFADNSSQIRIANTLILNFRNGCYEVDETSNLSLMSLGNTDITQGFMGGLHCGHELSGLVDNIFEGIQFHGNAAFNFEGEVNLNGTVTSVWYLNSIGESLNSLSENDSGTLRAFVGGDTNNDGVITIADKDFQPLRNSADAFFGGVTGLSVASQGYDLTVLGASRNSSKEFANEFDAWTLQTGGVFPYKVEGFEP